MKFDLFDKAPLCLKVERMGPVPYIHVVQRHKVYTLQPMRVDEENVSDSLMRFLSHEGRNAHVELLDTGVQGLRLIYNTLPAHCQVGATIGISNGEDWIDFAQLDGVSKVVIVRCVEDRGYTLRNPDAGMSRSWRRSQGLAWLGFHAMIAGSGKWRVTTITPNNLCSDLRQVMRSDLEIAGCFDDVLYEIDQLLKLHNQPSLEQAYANIFKPNEQ